MFQNILSDLSYGVYAVTTWDEGRAVGCIANSVMQITSEPPTVAISMNKDNYTHRCIENMGKFAVSILSEKSDPAIIGKFGFYSAADQTVEKFNGIRKKIVEFLPVLTDSIGCLICEVIGSFDCGSHTIFLGKVVETERFSSEKPMTYSYYHSVIKGTSPKNAPTFGNEINYTQEEKTMEVKYVCSVCGYIYDGDMPFEQLPDDYTCPLCGVGKDMFEKQEN